MKSRIKNIIMTAAVVIGVAVLAPSGMALAQSGTGSNSTKSPSGTIQDAVDSIGGKQETRTVTDIVKIIINVLLFFIGALSVIMIIFGGFKYITSAGDSNGVSSAKSTIMYAVIGLVVATLAFTLVNFVLDTFNGESDTTNAPYSPPPASRTTPDV